MKGFTFGALLADKGYDSNEIVEEVQAKGAEVVIPSKKNRVQPREHDAVLYKERNLVERLFNRLKQWRGVATRYAKLARNYLSAAYCAAIRILLK